MPLKRDPKPGPTTLLSWRSIPRIVNQVEEFASSSGLSGRALRVRRGARGPLQVLDQAD
jgi:hypothetical protein